MKKTKLFFILLSFLLILSISACDSKKDTEQIKEDLLGMTFYYDETTSDDLAWEVNGYRCDESGVITIHPDGSITKTYKEEYTYNEDADFILEFNEINDEDTYKSFDIRIEDDSVVLDIEGKGILKWYVYVDDENVPYAISASFKVYEIK